MHIVYSDEYDKLTPEMMALMEQAADIALSDEFGDELGAAGFAVKDTGNDSRLCITNMRLLMD